MCNKMETKESCSEVFQIDTKGLCLLCLRDGCTASYADSVANGGHDKNTFNFKVLLRYLKINTYKLCNFSSSFLENMGALEDTNIAVTLCRECGEMTKVFSKLYQDMEMIRLRMDSCLQNLHGSMERSKRSEIRMYEYRKRMRSRNMYEMFNASVVDSLRNETMKKCSERVDALIPRVAAVHQEQATLENYFGFPLLSKQQPRKIPGPKSKTMGKSMASSQQKIRGQFSSHDILRDSLSTTKNGEMEGSSTMMGTSVMQGQDCSEEFVVKVEPITIDHDMDSFHNENNEDEHDFQLDDGSAIANYDGQLIGHFLGARTSADNAMNSESSLNEKAGAFDCPYCSKSFLSAASLGGHLHIHKNRPKVQDSKINATPKQSVKKVQKRVIKRKRKFKCTTCKKTLTSEEGYRTHIKRFHGGNGKAGKGNKVFDCEICEKRFYSHTVHRTHMVSLHTMAVFSKYLPPGTTEEQLDASIQGVCAQFREVLDPAKKKSKLYGCQFCTHVLPHPSHLRLHLLRSHFDKVVLMLQSLFHENAEIETEGGGGNEEEDHVGGDTGEDEEEDVDPEPMPILLSMAYSLSEEGDDNDQHVDDDGGGEGRKGTEDDEEVSNGDPFLDL